MNKTFVLILIYLALTLLSLVLRTALWPKYLQNQGFFPQMIIPLLLHFFLHSTLIASTYLMLGVTLLTEGLSTYSFLELFSVYLLIYFSVFVSKRNWQKPEFFFASVFLWTLITPFVLQIPLLLFYKPHASPLFLPALINALVTLGVGYCILPFLDSLKNTFSVEQL